MTPLSRRDALVALAGAIVSAGGCRTRSDAASGACPGIGGRQIRWVVPNAAGGGYDTESRLLRPHLEAALGATIRIDNVAGAGGLIGARSIVSAPPDGLTLGIVGVPGLLVAALTGETAAPDPSKAFTILGRIARSWHVWATAGTSSLRSMRDVVAEAARRPLVFGINEIGSANFVSVTGASALLGLPVEFVGGFAGNRAASLAAIRGDVDLVCFNYETIRDLIADGELRPLLQVSSRAISPDGPLADVPLLGGPSGWAVAAAEARGEDGARARAAADGLAQVMGAGRVIVAPSGLPAARAACLQRVVGSVLTGPALRASTRRAIDPAHAEEALADVVAASATATSLVPLVRDRLARIRGTW